jgi:hypothetical protein
VNAAPSRLARPSTTAPAPPSTSAEPQTNLSRPYLLTIGGLMVATGAMTAAMNHGHAWVTPDSVTYLGVAQNIVHGKGVTAPFRNTLDPFSPKPSSTVPLIHWPPGYPVVLAAIAALGLAPITAAEVLNIACGAAVVALVAAIVWRTTQARPVTIAAAVLALVSNTIFQQARFALSDTLFLTVSVAFVYFAVRTAERRPHAVGLMTAAGSAAILVRWAGIALVVPAVFACHLGRRRHAVTLAMVGGLLALPILWLVYLQLGPAAAPRQLTWHPTLEMRNLGIALGQLVQPEPASNGWDLLLGSGVGLVTIAEIVYVSLRRSPYRMILVAFVVSYMAGLMGSRALFDAYSSWSDRLLSPVYVVIVLLTIDIAWNWKSNRILRVPAVAVLALLAFAQGASIPSLINEGSTASGYTSRYWHSVPTTQIAAALKPYPVIASNRPDIVYFWLHRSSLSLPQTINPVTTKTNPDVTAQLEALVATLKAGGAFINIDDPSVPMWYLVGEGQVLKALGFRKVASFKDAQIYAR